MERERRGGGMEKERRGRANRMQSLFKTMQTVHCKFRPQTIIKNNYYD